MVGERDGLDDGEYDGFHVEGPTVGKREGDVGIPLGRSEGEDEGTNVGANVGKELGKIVGDLVGHKAGETLVGL